MRKALLFLGILNDSDVDWMVAAGEKRIVAPGDVLIREGKPVESVFLVLDGAFSVTTTRFRDRQLARLMCGEIVGEMSFVDSRPPSASVTALEKSSVLAIPRDRLVEKLDDDVYFAQRFYRAMAVFLSNRLRDTVGLLGYDPGQTLDEDVVYDSEIDTDILDNLTLAGARFDWLQKRLRAL